MFILSFYSYEVYKSYPSGAPDIIPGFGGVRVIQSFVFYHVKLRMEMGNVSKRQQPDHRADNSRRPPMGLQRSEKPPHHVCQFSFDFTV